MRFWLPNLYKQFTLQTEKEPNGKKEDQSSQVAGCGGQQQLQGQETCITKCCKGVAKTLLSRMNQKIDPCDDFFQFACGKWLDENIIPDGKNSVHVRSSMIKRMNEQVRNM